MEQFLPRLYWVSKGLVEAARGRFIKWTGDGFLAWFETPLHRSLGEQAAVVFKAAWYLTLLVNVTQLGLDPERKFRIRHGVAYEQDALLISIAHPGGYQELDIIGRAVVLAFRLASLEAAFPQIATQGELVNAARSYGSSDIAFKRRTVTAVERLRYFKGERWGTGSVYVSSDRKPRRLTRTGAIRKAEKAVAMAEGKIPQPQKEPNFGQAFFEYMLMGPDWSREVAQEFSRFVEEELLGSLKKLLKGLSSVPPNKNGAR